MAKDKIGFEETELRLGLPGDSNNGGAVEKGSGNSYNNGEGNERSGGKKRGYSETMDLMFNETKKDKITTTTTLLLSANHPPPSKAQVVGWPPVRSFRKNILTPKKNDSVEEIIDQKGALVKVSMDGAPYLRKVDLKMYKSYKDLSNALGNMFNSFSTIGNCEHEGMKDFMNETKLIDLLNGSDYVPSYEDKDGDWMLVGDVPWEMFVESCKRLRIMKGKEAAGLAPKAMEKCKNRSQ